MSLVKCLECGKEISDRAVACPACGNPIQNRPVMPGESKTVEIVQTQKRWKKTSVWSLAFVFFALIGFNKSVGLGFFLLFVAFVLGMIARIGAWWTNG